MEDSSSVVSEHVVETPEAAWGRLGLQGQWDVDRS